jgi:hypothetical protein
LFKSDAVELTWTAEGSCFSVDGGNFCGNFEVTKPVLIPGGSPQYTVFSDSKILYPGFDLFLDVVTLSGLEIYSGDIKSLKASVVVKIINKTCIHSSIH